ncbi:MAG: tetratricopeptide repeat protein [Burkholderiales bacterium]|jgi:predicted O-linked N-acetylglucosamine transferase (SPINDLY family)|nr:tetratricopeptide repeat protein [Burkholderiales bacterium]
MNSEQSPGRAADPPTHRGGPGGAAPPAAGEPPREALLSLLALYNAGRHAELEPATLRTAAQYPRSAKPLHLLGASRLSRGQTAGAVEALRSALQRAPADADINNLLGVALSRSGQHDEARACFETSLAIDGGSYETLVNASASANAAGDAEGSRRLAARALALRPDGVEAMLNLGNALVAAGEADEADDVYRRALALAPNMPDLHLNLGSALSRRGRHGEAAGVLRQALALRPDYAAAHLNLGRALHELGDTRGAQRHFRAASDADPGLVEAHSAYLFSLAHDPGISPQDAYAEHLRIGEQLEAPYRAAWRDHPNDRDAERDLRVGFVSGDLHEHPLANLIEPIWRAMRRGRHRIYAYANGTWGDAVEARLKALTDQWLHVEKMGDQELSERIRADRIDILFDLSGHTARNRLRVFARRPAPVQVTWLGYPGTTGLSAIDYRLMRGHEPKREALQAQCRERIIHFGARAFEPPPQSPPVNPLPASSRGWLTFGSFNRPSKLGEGVIALWSRVLRALPQSRLLVAGVNERTLGERLLAQFAAHGVAAGRLEFRPRAAMREYLEMHHDVDIALDTFPYTGGTTTVFALWMGVPVLTLAGESLQQNQAAASIRALGLADWVTESEDEFVDRACRAAADLLSLARIRGELRPRAQRQLQGSAEVAVVQFDQVLRLMWRRWCSGQPPEGFVVQA